MQRIKADRHVNTLYVTYDVSEEIDDREFILDLQENCYRLNPGFSCVLNLPEKDPSNQTDKWKINCVENLMVEYGSGKIERVTEG